MCSNMCARPLIPATSCAEPALTTVVYENTGASWRSIMMTVRPLASFLTVVRFSNEVRSCAPAVVARSNNNAVANLLRASRMIPPDVIECFRDTEPTIPRANLRLVPAEYTGGWAGGFPGGQKS